MCRRLSSSMVVRYALGKRKRISYCELINMRKQLMSVGSGYLVDVSFRSILQVVRTYDRELEISAEHAAYSIKRKRTLKTGGLFNYRHLKKCYMS